MSKTLYYLGAPADGFGWGVCNTNLISALSKLCDVVVCTDANKKRFGGPVFVPIMDSSLRPGRLVKSPRVLGYAFCEWPMTPAAPFNAPKYDHIFAGSNWCADRIRSVSGAVPVSTLIQGVDHYRFRPQPYRERQGFRVFSGGKYEFRKAQDIVLAAMRVFMEIRKDAILVTSWHNAWPDTMKSMNSNYLIDPNKPFDGLPESRVFHAPPIKNEQVSKMYAETDIGLFPNRCEGGTNMVMAEYMACSRPVIASYATGQADLLNGPGPYRLTQGSTDEAGWFNVNVSDVLVQLEAAYQRRADLPSRGEQCRALIEPWTWDRAAAEVFRIAFQ